MSPLLRCLYGRCCSFGRGCLQGDDLRAASLFVSANAGCGPRHGCLSSSSHPFQSRVMKADRAGASATARPIPTGDLVGWEMRWVPSGPDPLHHNSSPKKPKTP
ncbi:hypothetical protein HPP92_009312 [Vanilla planifolia]|uniref:Uncharacterized protein n=1 Tax=Vanilla planifolia TaxID=51239 RepID=A0A835R7N0_VANPL|nr:hypothetical protein HPP92_009312 [Vanilla planifolia]